MNNLFVIKDYDTHEIIDVVITEYPKLCQNIFEQFEKERMENNDIEYDEFFKRLDKANIKYEIVNHIIDYYY